MKGRQRQSRAFLFALSASCNSRRKISTVTQRSGTRLERFSDSSRQPSQTSQRTSTQGPEPSYLTVALAAKRAKSISKGQHFPIARQACLMAMLPSDVNPNRRPTSNTPHDGLSLHVTEGWRVNNFGAHYVGHSSNMIKDVLTYEIFTMRHGSATTSASCMSKRHVVFRDTTCKAEPGCRDIQSMSLSCAMANADGPNHACTGQMQISASTIVGRCALLR